MGTIIISFCLGRYREWGTIQHRCGPEGFRKCFCNKFIRCCHNPLFLSFPHCWPELNDDDEAVLFRSSGQLSGSAICTGDSPVPTNLVRCCFGFGRKCGEQLIGCRIRRRRRGGLLHVLWHRAIACQPASNSRELNYKYVRPAGDEGGQ